MKLLIDIPEKIVMAIQNGEDYRYDIHTTIAQGIPVTEGDLIIFRTLMTEIANKGLPFEEVLLLIDNAPTVAVDCKDCDGYEAGYSAGLKDAERPQGEWIFDEKGNFYCEKCGKYPHDQYATTDFCPNCGACMQKGGAE